MELFKLVGSIFINNKEANSQIDETNTKSQNLASKIGSAMETAGNKITGIGKAIAPVSALLGTALTASTKSASDFQNGMAKMSTLFDTSKTSVSNLSKEFLTLSNKTGLSASELAEAGYQALSAGQSVDHVGKFVETAGNLAKAGFTSTTTAVDVLTTAMNAYGKSAGSADQIANKLVRTQNLGKTTVDELASAMGKVIPTASSMGVNINNLTSGYVSLTKQGIATAEATTYMNSMLNELGDSGTTLGGIIKKKTGMSFQDCMKHGMSLADVLQITKQYADENGIAYNELWGSAEAGKAGIAILNGGVEEFNDTVSTMASKTDDVGEALDKLNTPSVKIQKSLNQVKNSGIELGTAFITSLTPTIDKISSAIQKATEWFSGLDDGVKTNIATAMVFVTALSPVLIGLGKTVSAVGKLLPVVEKAKTAVTGAKVAIAGVSAPVLAVVAVIAVLIGAFVNLWKNNEDFRNKMTEIFGQIKQTISDFAVIFKARFAELKDAVVGFIGKVKPYWDKFCELLAPVFVGAFQMIADTVKFITDVFLDLISFLTGVFNGDWSAVWGAVQALFEDCWVFMENLIDTALQTISNVVNVFLGWFGTSWQSLWNSTKNFFSNIWNSIVSALQTAWNFISNVVQVGVMLIGSIISGAFQIITIPFRFIWENCKDTITSIWNAIKTVVSNAINNVKSVITTVMNAIKTVFSTVWNAIKGVITPILNAIKSSVSTIWNAIKSVVTTVVYAIKSVISSVFNAIKSTITSILNSIKSVFSSVWTGIKSTVTPVINSIKSVISNGLNSAKSTVTNILNAIKEKFSSILNGAKDIVKGAIDKIKGFFHFSWSLPKLKLPHISIKGSFSLTPPSVPKFGIDWYKKAMSSPFMFTQPTLFDVNPVTGTAKGAGEAGDEIMYGHSNLMNDIGEVMNSQNNSVVDALDAWFGKMFDMFSQYFPQFANMQMVTDTGALVGELAPRMDKKLGIMATHKGRGN